MKTVEHFDFQANVHPCMEVPKCQNESNKYIIK